MTIQKIKLTYDTNLSDVYKLEDKMSIDNVYKTYNSFKTKEEKIEFCTMMNLCYPALYNINWDNMINTLNA